MGRACRTTAGLVVGEFPGGTAYPSLVGAGHPCLRVRVRGAGAGCGEPQPRYSARLVATERRSPGRSRPPGHFWGGGAVTSRHRTLVADRSRPPRGLRYRRKRPRRLRTCSCCVRRRCSLRATCRRRVARGADRQPRQRRRARHSGRCTTATSLHVRVATRKCEAASHDGGGCRLFTSGCSEGGGDGGDVGGGGADASRCTLRRLVGRRVAR